jgi:hypothetical protein
MTFDDPAVADEAIVPDFAYLGYPTQGSNVVENRINWSFARLLTPTLAVTLDSGWIHQTWPIGHTSGFDKTNLGLKYEAYRDNKHEALVSVSVAWGIAHSGAIGVGTDAPNTIQLASPSARGLEIFPTHSHGFVRLLLLARSLTRNLSAQAVEPWCLTSRRAASRILFRLPLKRYVGVSPSNTARSI